ncbi:MAG: 2Fe-2S iron-sulfur cluster binding domain-containing protein [Pseudomonadota bacterium]|nr:2Fe-2S iron-sulfur cluster binding domain-containing protein [Pseudomonadota bacterium]
MSHSLTIEPTGEVVEVAVGQTMLDACLRAGVWLPHACCHGLCATCKVEVLDGEIDHGEASSFALMDFERDEGKALACCARLESDVTIHAELDEDPDARVIPVRDFDGTVQRVEALTPTIRGVFIELDQPIDFQAGQYVNLEIGSHPGTTRAFSIANPPGNGRLIELDVRRVPGGLGTGWVHDTLAAGDRVRLAGPYGRFFLRRSAGLPVLLIAGGSGLSSPRAMLHEMLAAGDTTPVTLVYGARSSEELYYHQEFVDLVARHPQLRYLPVLSHEPDGSAWQGARGFAHEAALRLYDGDFRGCKAYLCGPPAMIDACIDTLMKGRLFERDIYMEKFLSAADAQQVRSPLFRRI